MTDLSERKVIRLSHDGLPANPSVAQHTDRLYAYVLTEDPDAARVEQLAYLRAAAEERRDRALSDPLAIGLLHPDDRPPR